jgi:hypothetical protein
MDALIKMLAASLDSTFSGKEVGTGGDFGDTLTRGPYDIYCYFHQWSDIKYPNIAMQVVQEIHVGHALECCGGGVMELTVNFRVSIDSKIHGYSIGSALVEAVREWLCTISESDDLTAADYTYVAIVQVPDTFWNYEGEILNFHIMTKLHYIRQTATTP